MPCEMHIWLKNQHEFIYKICKKKKYALNMLVMGDDEALYFVIHRDSYLIFKRCPMSCMVDVHKLNEMSFATNCYLKNASKIVSNLHAM